MKALLTVRRDRKEWLLTEGDPLRLVGGDHMVQGRHARTALLIFTQLASGRPQSKVWGGEGYRGVVDSGLRSVVLVLPKAALRTETDSPLLLLVNLPSGNLCLKIINNLKLK